MMACVTCVTSTPSPPLLNPGYKVYCFNVSVVMAHIICVLKVATFTRIHLFGTNGKLWYDIQFCS
jgi:hypothetical protein